MSALAEGAEIVRFVLCREFLAKQLSVIGGTWHLAGTGLPAELSLDNLEYNGLRITAWVRDRSMRLLRENEFAKVIKHGVTFHTPVDFSLAGKPVFLTGIELTLQCKRAWLVQTIREDVSRGMYDHIKSVLLIPDKEFWSLEFDNRNWREITPDIEPDRSNAPAGTIQMHMNLFEPLFAAETGAAPLLDELVQRENTETSP
jgi:hypothetical protein